ncbi:hypothetical protein TTHERM_00191160 (macronuclear) [Tetrahymena thermophila SB210]|uniref:Uncharacterized protein n=1 Tax=Tetrahymena thermophila (strain SB210) TaxID=312017 RepID=I7MEJ0_TETTS|nr:hypothetical protein TTHERM_00191160 [Tetrahymena thermophila SB210]EAR96448.3 hypothetical protein TTHERM_00191160 [Tetrahymena thermophila SB210]|eukprot:XP_001016693.3 hypothetical protein TTHERM_00191160 [Tetrahymena thermophila SB210]
MENINDSADENRPGTSLNKKRGNKSEEIIQNKSSNLPNREKVSTQKGSRRGNQQYFDLRGSSSQSQFRTVNMTSSFYNQAQRDLGFNPPGSNQDFSKSLSSFHKGSVIGSRYSNKDFSKIIPKNIMFDKEVLYDELLKTKNNQNILVQENHSLKTKLIGMKEEIFRICKKEQINPYEIEQSKYKQLFKESANSTPSLNKQSQATLIFNLKKQITELQNEAKAKEQDLQKIQRSVKLTSIKELEVQLKMYSEECLRLRRMLEQQIKLDKDERLKINDSQEVDGSQRDPNSNYNQAFSLLKQDNIQMAANLKRQEEEIFAQRIVIETLEKQLRNQKHENQQQKRILVEKDREIESFKGNDPFVNNGKKNSQFTVEGQLKIELDKKQQEISLLTHQIQQKDKRIMDAEKRSREKEADLLDKLSAEVKEKQDLQNMLDKERDLIYKMRQDLERLQQDRRYTKVDIISSQATINDIENNNSPGELSSRQINHRRSVRQNTNISTRSFQTNFEQGSIQNLSRKRLQKVNSEEIQQIGENLKYKLKLQRITLNQLEKFLFKDEYQYQDVSLQEIYNAFQEYPFKMNDEGQILTLSRYLIEDNSQDWITFDPNQRNNISVVKSVLRHLLENYTIVSQQQEIRDMVKVTQQLNKQKGGLLDMLQRDPASKKINGSLCCDKKQLLYALDQLEIQLNSQEQECLFIKLYEENQSLDQIKIDSIFKIFNQERYNTLTEMNAKDLQDQSDSNQEFSKQNSQNNLPKQESKVTFPTGKKNSIKSDVSKSQLSNKSKAFKNVVANDFNVYNSNVDQEAVAANQNNYMLEDEEEVESQGQISNEDDHSQYQQNNRNQTNSNHQNVNNNNNRNNHVNNQSSQINYLNIAQEHEQLLAEQTNYTQKTNSQFQNDPNDPFQDSQHE